VVEVVPLLLVEMHHHLQLVMEEMEKPLLFLVVVKLMRVEVVVEQNLEQQAQVEQVAVVMDSLELVLLQHQD
jgi:hypothetical protein